MIDQMRLDGDADGRTPPAQIWSDLEPSYRLLCVGASPRSILVLKLDHVGDFCLALDALTTLRDAFPGARIVLACAPWNVPIAEALGLADEVYPLQFFAARAEDMDGGFDPSSLGLLATVPFDLAIDLRIDPDTRVVLDHVQSRFRFGYDGYQSAQPLTLALPRPEIANTGNVSNHQSLLMLRLAQVVVSFAGNRDRPTDRLRAGCVPKHRPAVLSVTAGPIVAMCTGSGRRAKDWPVQRYAQVARWLIETLGATVLLLGSKDQAHDAALIAQNVPINHLIDMVGKTHLVEAIGLVGHSDLFVGNDTGLTHYAARLGIPTIAIFSGIDPTAVWAPVGTDVTVVRAPVACSPCHILRLEDCRHRHACMQSIPVQDVQAAIRRGLARTVVRSAENRTFECGVASVP